MTLSIIIVNYNTGALTHALLESLLKQNLPQKTEIIVVDNGSSDDSVWLLRSDFPEVTVIDHGENKGLAAGVNRALRDATGRYLLILNPDMIALPGSVRELLAFMEKNRDVGVAGGKLLSPSGHVQHSCFRFYRPLTILYRRTWLGKTARGRQETFNFLMKDFDRSEVRDVDWLQGACLLVRREALDKVGGMDERYFLYFEDVDWCRRFWEHGWRVTFVPKAVFSHFHQRSSEGSTLWAILTNRPTREHIKSAAKYFWKFRGRPLPHRG